MRLLFDGRIYQFQKVGGINRYFSQIISALPDSWVPIVTGVGDFGENRPEHASMQLESPPEFRPRRFQPFVSRHWWKPRLLKSLALCHPSYYDLTCGLSYDDLTCPVVVTVYDMIYAKFFSLMEGASKIVQHQRKAVRRADKIVCISNSTERDLLELMPEAQGKTEVIYLGSSLGRSSPDLNCKSSKTNEFLYVGGRYGYKNFNFLLRAFAKAADKRPYIRLTVAGAPLSTEERWQMHFLRISDRISSVIYPDEIRLMELYSSCAALLYPSCYEGFGIPPLEAMSCGTIAVTGNLSSLPEVMGDAGIMLDSGDEDLWADCILQLSEGLPDRASMLQQGFAQAAKFSWTECARRHIGIYESLRG